MQSREATKTSKLRGSISQNMQQGSETLKP
jgi:hypothetical protein